MSSLTSPLSYPRVNVAGYSFMVQALTDHIKSYSGQQNSSVVNLSSISAHQTQPNRPESSSPEIRDLVRIEIF